MEGTLSLPEGLPLSLTVNELMLCRKEPIIICNNYGGATTLDLAISCESKEKKEAVPKKGRRQRSQSSL